MPTFDPAFLTPEISMNRVTIVDLPGYSPPSELQHSRAYDLVSTEALDTLLLDSDLRQKSESPVVARNRFYGLLATGDALAIQLAKQLGTRLGWILLALHRGDEINREARAEWSTAHWEYWANIKHVIIGGGLSNARLGKILREEAQRVVQSVVPEYRVQLARRPQHLPLLGAARYVPTGDKATVFDFGGTFIKRGHAIFHDDHLQRLEIQPSISLPWTGIADPQQICDQMVEVIVSTLKSADCAPIIPISIASYVDRSGNPLTAQQGIYMKLKQLGENIPALLSDSIFAKTGRHIQIRLIHDGTAAASFYSPTPNCAVITIGTALGIGFPVERTGLRPVADDLRKQI